MYEELVKRLRYENMSVLQMCDLMDEAADAIEELRYRVTASEATIKRQSDIIQAKDRDLQRAINAKPQWIPVTERLPVNTKSVLIVHRGGVSTGWHNGRYWERGASTNHRPIQTVTHWRPLPEPPKEE